MGFRFRRSIRILPGVRLNVSKSGVSTSIGGRGAHVTIGKSGTRTTVGLPGTGVSYTHLEKGPGKTNGEPMPDGPMRPEDLQKGKAWRGWLWFALLVFFFGLLLFWSRS